MRTLLLATLLSTTATAATMTNTIGGVGPGNRFRPWICVANESGAVTLPLAPGASGDANRASGNASYAGAALRFGGCTWNDSYLGYAGFSISSNGATNTISSYTPPEGVHIAWLNPGIDSSGRVSGSIRYTPIDINPHLPSPSKNIAFRFAGINLSGLEFGKMPAPVVIPNLSEQDAKTPQSDLQDTSDFINAGMNTVRVPVAWSYLQPEGPGKGTIDTNFYQSFMRPTLATLTRAKIYTIVDLHAYMRYSDFGKQYSGCGAEGACPDGSLVLDTKAWQSIWGQLWDAMASDPQIDTRFLMFDLVNEPVGVPGDAVFRLQADLINMLRAKGFEGYILVEGNNWSGLHSWTTTAWAGTDGGTLTNATLFTRERFNRAGIFDLSKILINVHQYLDADYSGTQNTCLQDLSTVGSNGFNLIPFVNYLHENNLQAIVTEFGAPKNAESCKAPLRTFLQYLKDNRASGNGPGFAGWTVWASGHGWGDYLLRVTPKSWQMEVLAPMLTE